MNIFRRWTALLLISCLLVELLPPAAGSSTAWTAARGVSTSAGAANGEALSPPILLGCLAALAPFTRAGTIHWIYRTSMLLSGRDWMSVMLVIVGSLLFGGILYWRSPRLDKKLEAAAILCELSLRMSGIEELPLEYLTATVGLLKRLRDDPEKNFDMTRLAEIQFVPWYRSLWPALFAWTKSEETFEDIVHSQSPVSPPADAAKKKPGKILARKKITVIVHWHPRLFAEELKNKVGAATLKSASDDAIARSWSPTSEPLMVQFLIAQLVMAVGGVSFLLWQLSAALGRQADSTFKISIYLMGLALGATNSYYTNGLVARLTAWLMGGSELVLDPRKTIDVLPISSLSSPEQHRANVIATQLPRITLTAKRSFTYWRTLAPALMVYVAFLGTQLPADLFALAVIGATGVVLFSGAHTAFRLAAFALRERGKAFLSRISLRRLHFAAFFDFIRGTLTQGLAIFHEALRWIIPPLIILVAANHAVREAALEMIKKVEIHFVRLPRLTLTASRHAA